MSHISFMIFNSNVTGLNTICFFPDCQIGLYYEEWDILIPNCVHDFLVEIGHKLGDPMEEEKRKGREIVVIKPSKNYRKDTSPSKEADTTLRPIRLVMQLNIPSTRYIYQAL